LAHAVYGPRFTEPYVKRKLFDFSVKSDVQAVFYLGFSFNIVFGDGGIYMGDII
jgi:hypothetical protein